MSWWPGATRLFDRKELPVRQPWSPHTYGEAQAQNWPVNAPSHVTDRPDSAGFGRTGALNPRLQGKKQNCAKSVFSSCFSAFFLFSSFSPESWGQIRISRLLFPSALGTLPDSSPSCGSTAADSLAELAHLDLEESDTLCIASSSCRQDFRTPSQCPGR